MGERRSSLHRAWLEAGECGDVMMSLRVTIHGWAYTPSGTSKLASDTGQDIAGPVNRFPRYVLLVGVSTVSITADHVVTVVREVTFGVLISASRLVSWGSQDAVKSGSLGSQRCSRSPWASPFRTDLDSRCEFDRDFGLNFHSTCEMPGSTSVQSAMGPI
jgi:hypothetical protein